jgi:hypothetical protein
MPISFVLCSNDAFNMCIREHNKIKSLRSHHLAIMLCSLPLVTLLFNWNMASPHHQTSQTILVIGARTVHALQRTHNILTLSAPFASFSRDLQGGKMADADGK